MSRLLREKRRAFPLFFHHPQRAWVLVLLACWWLQLAAVCAARQVEGEAPWLRIDGDEVTVLTNAEAERGLEIAAALQRFRAVFSRLAPALELNSPAPTTLLAFRDRQSYAPYKTVADRGSSRILGQFISHPSGNYLTLDAGTELVSSLSVIHHEYVHYFVRHNFPGVPLWFNEGLAEYYSTFASDDEGVHLGGAVDRHLAWLRRQGELDLSDILAADTRSESYHAPDQVGGFYATSWLLVHYLLSGDSEQLGRAADFFTLLQEGEEPTGAFEDAFEMRLSSLEDRLRDYVASASFESQTLALEGLPSGAGLRVRALSSADAYFHRGDLLAHIGRRQDAESHFQRALDLHPEHADSLAGMAFLRDLSGRLPEARLLFEDALALGSDRPQTFVQYGRHVLRRAQHTPASEPDRLQSELQQAREALRYALQLKDDYGEAWYLLGLAYTGPSGEPGEALQALEEAHRLLPSRLDVVGQLAQAYARLGHRDPAEDLVEGLLRPRGEPNAVAEVENEVERLLLMRAAQEAYEEEDFETAADLVDQAISYTQDSSLRERLEAMLEDLQRRLE